MYKSDKRELEDSLKNEEKYKKGKKVGNKNK